MTAIGAASKTEMALAVGSVAAPRDWRYHDEQVDEIVPEALALPHEIDGHVEAIVAELEVLRFTEK